MKKIFLFSIILFAYSNAVISQKVELIPSTGNDKIKRLGNNTDDYILKTKSGIYIYNALKESLYLSYNNENFYNYIEFYDNQYKKIKEVKIDLMYADKKRFFEDVICFNEKLYLFTSYLNQSEKKMYYFMQTIDNSTLALNNDITIVSEIKFETAYQYSSADFKVAISKDSTKFAVISNQSFLNKKNNEIFIKVFNRDLKIDWEKRVILNYDKKLCEIKDVIVNSKGDINFLALMYNSSPKKTVNNKANYKYSLLTCTQKGNKIIETSLPNNEKYISSMKLVETNTTIYCVGFYSNDADTYSLGGSCSYKIDLGTYQIIGKDLKNFSKETIGKYLSAKKRESLKGDEDIIEYTEFFIRDIVYRKDGGAYLIGEDYRKYSTSSSISTLNGDILVIGISPDSKIEWDKRIKKYQYEKVYINQYASVASMIYNDNLYLLYNEDIENFEYNPDVNWKEYNLKDNFNEYTMFLEIKKDGTMNREILPKTIKKGTPVLKTLSKISNNEYIITFEQFTSEVLVRIKFK